MFLNLWRNSRAALRTLYSRVAVGRTGTVPPGSPVEGQGGTQPAVGSGHA